MKIIISGGRGIHRVQLVPALLSAGHSVAVWSRDSRGEAGRRGGVSTGIRSRDRRRPRAWKEVDAVIHLAGESVAHRWTDELKKKIRESRVSGHAQSGGTECRRCGETESSDLFFGNGILRRSRRRGVDRDLGAGQRFSGGSLRGLGAGSRRRTRRSACAW